MNLEFGPVSVWTSVYSSELSTEDRAAPHSRHCLHLSRRNKSALIQVINTTAPSEWEGKRGRVVNHAEFQSFGLGSNPAPAEVKELATPWRRAWGGHA